jgi:hypothetical protein
MPEPIFLLLFPITLVCFFAAFIFSVSDNPLPLVFLFTSSAVIFVTKDHIFRSVLNASSLWSFVLLVPEYLLLWIQYQFLDIIFA